MKTLSKQQIAWASQHDWFVRATDDGGVVCMDWSVDANGQQVNYEKTFYRFPALRAWAGY